MQATRNPVTLLTSLYESVEQWEETVLRWHLSNHERDLGHYVIAHRDALDCFKVRSALTVCQATPLHACQAPS
jgi:hypothetical protein